ncbi:hypothetical protein M8542_34070 [Amycolatopsis sp. OK19-0408]|uniref:Uncharacterized protein n=1 Tax=Amycolatopsis iheyensis TaxID=2945988 RepID=A0A9X2NJE1_9PSEU|nr:hypothetical protein [Amycolatopsis iheyensis]MCR6487865.1 hypothetical protein [Amycolatopsis iheyensis]
MTETSFACALSAAIDRAGLSLRRLQRALEVRGTTVSVATLSYWSSGRSRPERDVATVLAALEEVLHLPGGELSALLGARRCRGPAARSTQDVHRMANAWGAPVSLRDALADCTVPPVRAVARHDTLYLDHRGVNERLAAAVTLLATAPTRRAVVLVRGASRERIPVLGRTRGCVLRRCRVVAGQGLALLELELDRLLLAAETGRIEYEVLFDDDVRNDHWFLRTHRTVRDLRLTAVFTAPMTPAAVAVVAPGPHRGVQRTATGFTAAAGNVRPGCFGLRWSWPDSDADPGSIGWMITSRRATPVPSRYSTS